MSVSAAVFAMAVGRAAADGRAMKPGYGAVEPARFDLEKVEPLSAVTAADLPREGTNSVPLKGASDLDVIRAGAAAFYGTAKATEGTLEFTISGDEKPLWSSGPLKAGESRDFELDVREVAIVTFSTKGGGAGAWDGIKYACNTKMWKGGDDLRGISPLATYRESVIERNPPWENPRIFAVNRCASHVPIFAYDTVEAARASKSREDSPWFIPLDGVWKVKWAPEPAKAPVGFESAAFDVSRWPTVKVPESLECAGFGTALFRNVGYYWSADPPFVPRPAPTNFLVHAEPNGTASYRREFTVPASWSARRTFLRFDGFASAIDVWVNGTKIGYAQDGRQGAESDVTDVVKPGGNTLAVRTYRLCDGSYMEDQDFYRLSGIIRPVFLRSEPEKRIRDFAVATVRASEDEPHAGGTWLLKVDADIPGDYLLLSHDYKVKYDTMGYQKPRTITLTANEGDPYSGKIAGAKIGTWRREPGTDYFTLVIGSLAYRGVLCRQTVDYSNASALCFTVVSTSGGGTLGSNAQLSLWGAKVDAKAAIKCALDELTVPVTDGMHVTQNLTLPVTTTARITRLGASVRWSSSNEEILTSTGVVKGDGEVVLTLTISKEGRSYNKSYRLLVGDLSGITNINNDCARESELVDLYGRRVQQPYGKMYIIRGRKVFLGTN